MAAFLVITGYFFVGVIVAMLLARYSDFGEPEGEIYLGAAVVFWPVAVIGTWLNMIGWCIKFLAGR